MLPVPFTSKNTRRFWGKHRSPYAVVHTIGSLEIIISKIVFITEVYPITKVILVQTVCQMSYRLSSYFIVDSSWASTIIKWVSSFWTQLKFFVSLQKTLRYNTESCKDMPLYCITLKFREHIIFEPTCANAQWAHICIAFCLLSVTGPKIRLVKNLYLGNYCS